MLTIHKSLFYPSIILTFTTPYYITYAREGHCEQGTRNDLRVKINKERGTRKVERGQVAGFKFLRVLKDFRDYIKIGKDLNDSYLTEIQCYENGKSLISLALPPGTQYLLPSFWVGLPDFVKGGA